MCYKMTKKYQICHHQIRFFKLKMHQNPFLVAPDSAVGAYDAPPDPLVGWGWGYRLPIPLPARHLRRLELGAIPRLVCQAHLNTKSCLRQC